MKLYHAVTIENSITHKCGQMLHLTLTVSGEDMTAQFVEHRFTFRSFFSANILAFKAHGSRVKKCPGCGEVLPREIENVNDEDFKSGDKQ